MRKAAPAGAASVRSGPAQTRIAGIGRPSLKMLVLSVVLVLLGGILGFSLSRETLDRPAVSSARLALPTPRPARSPDEDRFVQALWPIHTDLEVASERVALGTIFYKTNDLDRSALRARLDQALGMYRADEGKLRELRPPPSMQTAHEGYLAAVSLFEASATEMLQMFADGSDDHLLTAYPLHQQGTDKIRDLGGLFWPDEFPAN